MSLIICTNNKNTTDTHSHEWNSFSMPSKNIGNPSEWKFYGSNNSSVSFPGVTLWPHPTSWSRCMLVMFLKPPQCCYANQSSSQPQRWGQVWSHDPTVIGEDGADVDGALHHWMISQAQAHKIEVTTRTDVKGQHYKLWSLNTFIFTLLIIEILQLPVSESLRGDWQDRDTEGNHFSTWNPTAAHREEQQQGEGDF